MDPKFLVIEIDSKEQALQLVQVMLDKGFARLMLLDDLGKHPTLVRNQKDESREVASSPIHFQNTSRAFPAEEEFKFSTLSQDSSSMTSSTVIKQEPSDTTVNEDEEAVEEEEEEMTLTSRKTLKRSYETTEEHRYREQLLSMLHGQPEIVPIGVNSVSDEPYESKTDGEEKRWKTGEYHECRLCGVRVKTPRSGRWNLQMHVIALHCVGRQYKCKECDYLDYRKSTMRKHTTTHHGSDIPPHNLTNDVMKREWHEAMIKCFPEFADRTGFLS